jgi:hypothetical protein
MREEGRGGGREGERKKGKGESELALLPMYEFL